MFSAVFETTEYYPALLCAACRSLLETNCSALSVPLPGSTLMREEGKAQRPAWSRRWLSWKLVQQLPPSLQNTRYRILAMNTRVILQTTLPEHPSPSPRPDLIHLHPHPTSIQTKPQMSHPTFARHSWCTCTADVAPVNSRVEVPQRCDAMRSPCRPSLTHPLSSSRLGFFVGVVHAWMCP